MRPPLSQDSLLNVQCVFEGPRKFRMLSKRDRKKCVYSMAMDGDRWGLVQVSARDFQVTAKTFLGYTLSTNSEGECWLVGRLGHLNKVNQE